MLPFALSGVTQPRRILCLGAHSDDIEIGCGGTVLALLEGDAPVEVQWVVCCADGIREREARASVDRFLSTAATCRVVVEHFRDGFFPFEGARIKEFFEATARDFAPDLIFTHHRDDRHQDHRLISDLTWQTFRDHLILEYEVPKYDGDLGRPNCYMPITEGQCHAKIDHLLTAFASQRKKHWFTEETFRGE
jgi:LmbE family N-acetylglucosaminyl deacetylase